MSLGRVSCLLCHLLVNVAPPTHELHHELIQCIHSIFIECRIAISYYSFQLGIFQCDRKILLCRSCLSQRLPPSYLHSSTTSHLKFQLGLAFETKKKSIQILLQHDSRSFIPSVLVGTLQSSSYQLSRLHPLKKVEFFTLRQFRIHFSFGTLRIFCLLNFLVVTTQYKREIHERNKYT